MSFVERLPKDLNAVRTGSDREWGRSSPYKKRAYVPGDPSLNVKPSSKSRTKKNASDKGMKGRPPGSKNKGVQIHFLTNRSNSCHIDCIAFAFFALFSRVPRLSEVIERSCSNVALKIIATSFRKWSKLEPWSASLQDAMRRMCLIRPDVFQSLPYALNRMFRGAESDSILNLAS